MSQPKYDASCLHYPVIAFSKAGWNQWADCENELSFATPQDTLEEWQGMEIYDAEGLYYVANRAFRRFPKSLWAYWLCRLAGETIFVGFELTAPTKVSLEELRERLLMIPGNAHLSYEHADSHRELLEIAS